MTQDEARQRWLQILGLIVTHYADKPDTETVSLGTWDAADPEGGLPLPDFRAYLALNLGELRRMHATA